MSTMLVEMEPMSMPRNTRVRRSSGRHRLLRIESSSAASGEAAGTRGAEDGEPPSGMRASGRPGRPCVSAPSGREEADGRSGGMNPAETFGPPSDDPRHPGGGTLTGRNGTSVFVGVRCRSPSRNAASPL